MRNGKRIKRFFCVKAGKDEKVTNWNRYFNDNGKTMTKDEKNEETMTKNDKQDKKKEKEKNNLSI